MGRIILKVPKGLSLPYVKPKEGWSHMAMPILLLAGQ